MVGPLVSHHLIILLLLAARITVTLLFCLAQHCADADAEDHAQGNADGKVVEDNSAQIRVARSGLAYRQRPPLRLYKLLPWIMSSFKNSFAKMETAAFGSSF
jgi:hypothetical protein